VDRPDALTPHPAVPTPRIAVVYSNEQPLDDPAEDLGVGCALALQDAGALALLSLPAESAETPSTHRLRARLGAALLLRIRRPRNLAWRSRYRRHRENIFHEDLRAARPDLVLIAQGDAFDGHHCADWCLQAGIPFALLCGPTGEFLWQADDRLDRTRRVFLGARRTWMPCEATRAEATLQAGIDLPRCDLLPVVAAVPPPAPLAWPDLPLRIAFVGASAVPGDGLDLALQVLARPEWRERAIPFTVFTRSGMLRWAHDAVAWLDLPNVRLRTDWTGSAEPWREHHLGLFPRRRSGIDPALVAALQTGRPAVGTPAGGTSALLRDGENGFIARTWTPDHVADALERAWSARAAWRTMGERAAGLPVIARADAAAALCRELFQLVGGDAEGSR